VTENDRHINIQTFNLLFRKAEYCVSQHIGETPHQDIQVYNWNWELAKKWPDLETLHGLRNGI
jgi:hypothetical protein